MEENLADIHLAEFIKDNPPLGRKPRLASQEARIQQLLDLGYSQTQVLAFLRERLGISISQAALSRFIAGMRQAGEASTEAPQIPVKQVHSKAQNAVTASTVDKTGGIIEPVSPDIVQKNGIFDLDVSKYQKEEK